MLDSIIIAAIKASLGSNGKITTVPSTSKKKDGAGVPITSAINWDTIDLTLSNINALPVSLGSIDNDIFENRLLSTDTDTSSQQLTYYYYNSMNGTCPACLLTGGDFELSGGITYPNSDGPAQNEQGYPLGGFSTCEALQEAIAAEPYVSGAEIIVGYPILWSITYKDGTTIEGVGCENVPADFADAVAQNSAGLSEEECSDLSEQYPNVNISFNMFDTTLISSTTQPSGALGTPCSDLFAISK